MDVFDRLGNLLKSLLQEDELRRADVDPDFASAWEELDRYIAGEEPPRSHGPRFKRGFSRGGRAAGTVPEELRQDFRNLEVEFGAPLEQVRKSYRSLVVTYHPDRFASNPRKSHIATEITKKLGESYRRIRSYYESRTNGE